MCEVSSFDAVVDDLDRIARLRHSSYAGLALVAGFGATVMLAKLGRIDLAVAPCPQKMVKTHAQVFQYHNNFGLLVSRQVAPLAVISFWRRMLKLFLGLGLFVAFVCTLRARSV